MVGDDEHITYIDTARGLWEELAKNSENTLEQIAVEGVGQSISKQIVGSWSQVTEKTQTNCSNVLSATPSITSYHLAYVTCSSSECNLITNNYSQNDNSFFTVIMLSEASLHGSGFNQVLSPFLATFGVKTALPTATPV